MSRRWPAARRRRCASWWRAGRRRKTLAPSGGPWAAPGGCGWCFFPPPLLGARRGGAWWGVLKCRGGRPFWVARGAAPPPEALRLVVASRQAAQDPGAERRAVGGAVVVWLLFLPLATVVGAVLTWYAPALAGVAPELAGTVRLACAALLGAVLLGGLLAVPESVLFGMNLGYKRMELQAGLSGVGGGLTAAAAYAGLGLAGVSGAQLAIAAITGLKPRFMPNS